MNDNQPQDKLSQPLEGEHPDASGPTSGREAPVSKPGKRAKSHQPAYPTPRHTPPVGAARLKRRHHGVALSFLGLVVLPLLVAAWYLWTQAQDQYVSRAGFVVRREEIASAVDVFGGLANLSSTDTTDSDILYEFIQSREMVQAVDQALDLRALYSKFQRDDALFSLRNNASIEALHRYWQNMVKVSYASGTGLIKIEVKAFAAADAQEIAEEIVRQSTRMINDLSAIAREDAIKYARVELETAMDQLREARQAITAFRSRTQILNPSADIQIQMGLLTSLQQRLGDEMITHDMLLNNTSETDPRVIEARQRIAAISERIRQERAKFGVGGAIVSHVEGSGEDYATVLENFESLTVDREFAEQKYTAALSNFDLAQAEAQRQSRYLAAFVHPTLAEVPEYPQRAILFGLSALFLTIGWATVILIVYSLRDRR